jgi:uncharacterized protein (DUF1330 family)
VAAYLLGEIEITDPAGFDAYRRDVGDVIARFGGRYLARGGPAEMIEGQRPLRRVVLLEFPDMAALKAFYASPEYQPLLALRLASANTDALIFEGV